MRYETFKKAYMDAFEGAPWDELGYLSAFLPKDGEARRCFEALLDTIGRGLESESALLESKEQLEEIDFKVKGMLKFVKSQF